MNQEVNGKKLKVLVAPLDWGLGHATRCIPIIYAFLEAKCEVILAGEGKTATLLQAEFPQLSFLHLQGYAIEYAKGVSLKAKLIAQIPKIKAAIIRENLWLQQVVIDYKIDAVLSDNRYGLYHSTVPSVLITHQLLIKTGFGPIADRILQRIAYKYINRFTQCWVPDNEGSFSFAGALSHPASMPFIPVHYISILSRFQTAAEEPLNHYILILLSGPEPQRTILEEQLLQQAKDLKEHLFFVRGLPGTATLPSVPYAITIVNHLPTFAMQKAIEGAAFVICRSGYSSVMDVTTLQKKAIMIPTPGQTEQEYLANYLTSNKVALCIPQSKFKLKNALELATTFPYHIEKINRDHQLKEAVLTLLQHIAGKE
ncbi:MAG TPA: glycosyltransferase [Chitinophagaceae bacterium]|nr:glycosyltransferase [Chitinophagaceae bacterium]